MIMFFDTDSIVFIMDKCIEKTKEELGLCVYTYGAIHLVFD